VAHPGILGGAARPCAARRSSGRLGASRGASELAIGHPFRIFNQVAITTRALPNQTRALSNQTRALSNQTRARPKQPGLLWRDASHGVPRRRRRRLRHTAAPAAAPAADAAAAAHIRRVHDCPAIAPRLRPADPAHGSADSRRADTRRALRRGAVASHCLPIHLPCTRADFIRRALRRGAIALLAPLASLAPRPRLGAIAILLAAQGDATRRNASWLKMAPHLYESTAPSPIPALLEARACVYARVCMYVCIHVCVYVCTLPQGTHICVYVCMHVCMYARCRRVRMHECMTVCVYVCTCVCVYAWCLYVCRYVGM
jgi:hypothetical protein